MFDPTISIPARDILKKNLKFYDGVLEEEFRRKKEIFQNRIFPYTLGSIIIISMVIWLASKYQTNPDILIFNCSKIVMLLFYYMAQRKWPESKENIMTVILIPLEIGITLNSIENENENPDKVFLNGIIYQLFSLSGIFLKLSWIRQCISLVFLNVTICIKVFSSQSGFRNIFLLIGNFLTVILIGYVNEKYERLYFFENKKAEKSLRFFENFIRRSIPLGVVIIEKQKVIFNNRESFKLLGLENKENLELDDLNKVNIKDDNDQESTLLEKINEKFGVVTLNTTYNNCSIKRDDKDASLDEEFTKYRASIPSIKVEKTNNQSLNVSINHMVWRDHSGIIILLGEDLDGLKLETMKQYDEYKNNVLASISHQLRTPLNGVMGILENVAISTLERSTKEALDIALRSSQRLLSFINNIIDLGQINTGNFSLEIEEFYIEDVIKEVADYTKMEASRRQVDFIIENKTNILNSFDNQKKKKTFCSDPQRLKQVLQNFLSNSIKFTYQGFIKLSYEIVDKPVERVPVINFSVEDSGTGISENGIGILYKVFEKIELNEIKELNLHGMGLGLAITNKLLEFMNSEGKNKDKRHISIKSALGKGSRFEFYVKSFPKKSLTYLETDETEERSLKDSDITLNINTHNLKRSRIFKNRIPTYMDILLSKRKRILIVDDDPVNTLVIKKYLDFFAKYDYICAENGLEGLNIIKTKKIQNYSFDLILMDCNMPIMDGFCATREINKLIEKHIIPFVPIVAVTANVLQTELDKCLECGMMDYLTKPLTREKLKEKLDKYVIYDKNDI